jgi:uncharacterized delta-60 repeat protein
VKQYCIAADRRNVVKETIKKITGRLLCHLAENAGCLKLGLVLLIGLMVSTARAQTNFASAQVLSGDWGAVTNNNTGITPDPGAPSNAGFAPKAPLWYQWTAPQDGVVQLDTVGSVSLVTNVTLVGLNTNTIPITPIFTTNVVTGPKLDTVLAVYTGTTLSTLSQAAANDDLFPINNTVSLTSTVQPAQTTESGNADYLQYISQALFIGGVVISLPLLDYIQPYYGPSGLRFNAKGGQTYYFVVDTKSQSVATTEFSLLPAPPATGPIALNWAYKPSGVFRFASEDEDFFSGLLLYQAAQTESALPAGTGNSANSTVLTYYSYNAPGALVTVTRVAGSTGRATVRYTTVDGTALPVATNDLPAFGEVTTNFTVFTNINIFGGTTNVFTNATLVLPDYTPVSGTLVFDDFEMSKTIIIPIIDKFSTVIGDQTNRVFGIKLIDDGGVTSPALDPFESPDVSQPRVDPTFSTAMVRILNVDADPYGPDRVPVVVTNTFTITDTNVPPIFQPFTTNIVSTNIVIAAFPTNVIFNFEKAHYRVPADVNDTTVSPWTQVTLWVERGGTNTSAATINYRVNNFLGDDANQNEEENIIFPLQPGSDYAVPTPSTQGNIRGTNSDFVLAQGTLNFPSSGNASVVQPITFTVPTSQLTKFNKDFKVQIYREVSINNQTTPELVGMVNEATVTILFNDLNPPAGSVDELYNADFNSKLALAPQQIPVTNPQNNSNPGISGEAYGLAVLTNDETIVAGDFASYNGFSRNCVALANTDGSLDTSFNPGTGANAAINAVATDGNQFVIGGSFTSFNGTPCARVARLNADGSVDTAFSTAIGLGADGPVRSVLVQTNGEIVVAGDFTHFNGFQRNHVALLTANGNVDSVFNPSNTLNGPVYALAEPPSVVFHLNRNAAGNSNEDDQPINLGTLTAGVLTVNYNMFAVPDDMRIFYGDTNVAGGTGVLIFDTGSVSFSNTIVLPFGPIGGITTNLLTIVMNQGGSTNVTQWTYNASVTVPQVASGILVGGLFNVAGQTYANLARLNNTNGSLDTTFNPGTGTDNKVLSLAWQLNGQVVVGGLFTHINNNAYNYIVRLNPDGSIDTTNFFIGTGADNAIYSLTLHPLDGAIYVGGAFSSFNGTHRLGFARLYANGTVDTTFLDTAFNQFAGLKRIYSYDLPAIFTSGVQSDGNILIGGSFDQVGGGQADTNVCNVLDDEFGYTESFGDANLWVEPKTRDGVRNRSSIARLIGGATPGPGNIQFSQNTYTANKSQTVLAVSLVRTNGTLGPISANFSVQPILAQSGRDYAYNSPPPLYWIDCDFLTNPSRVRTDGLSGQNNFLVDPYGLSLTKADAVINNLSAVNISVIKNNATSGNLNAQFQLANPSYADQFYLGGENIPLSAALGASSAPFTLVDDTQKPGTFGFSSSSFVATNFTTPTPISVLRSNGVFGVVSMNYSVTNGTAFAGTDYVAVTKGNLNFQPNVISNGFTVTVKNTGVIYTNVQEKTVNLSLFGLGTTPGATFGISNAVLHIINPNYQGYLTLSATNYASPASSGSITFIVNRTSGSKGSLTVKYATTDGSATNGVDYTGATNTLQWSDGDVSPRPVTIPLASLTTVNSNKQFSVTLSNPTLNGVATPSLFGLITSATLTIINDNSYGSLQFSAPAYAVNENGGYATITVTRTGGAVGPVSVNFATTNGPNAFGGTNFVSTNGTLSFVNGQISSSFTVPILDDGVADTQPFYFPVLLSNPVNAALGVPTNALVSILDVETFNRPPGSPDSGFNFAGINGDVFTVALQTNGQILAGGNFTAVGSVPENSLARLNADGTLDTTFLNNLSGANGAVLTMVDQTDGQILVGGGFSSIDSINRNFIARLNTDGSLDTSFNPGFGADNTIDAMAETFIAGTRKIYIGGLFANVSGISSPSLARLNNDGSADVSFATGSGADASVLAIVVYPTNSIYAGKLLIGGAFTHFNGTAVNRLMRLNADGSVDTNFNANLGIGPDAPVHSIAIQSDGRVLFGGDFLNYNGVALNHVGRLNPDGTLDTNFAASLGVGASGSVLGVALQPDNRILLVGQFTQANGVTRNHITRLMPTGAADPTINFGDGANGDVDAVVVQPANGMIVIGGAFTQYNDQSSQGLTRIYGGSVVGSGSFKFSAANYQVSEKGLLAAIGISRTGGTSGTNADGSGGISVFFSTSDGTATNGINYQGVATTVNFPFGETFETVYVPVFDDMIITPNLTVNLSLKNPTPPAGIGDQPTATLTILNSDSAVSFSSAFYAQVKNVPTGVATIDIIRSGGTDTVASVDFFTTTNGTAVAGTDYIPTNSTVIFNVGQSDVPVAIPIINNGLAEGNRTVGLVLTNAVNTLLASPSNATLTIIDTVSAPGQLSFVTTNYFANEGDGNAYLTLVRTNGSSGSVSVTYTAVPGTAQLGVNYNATTGTITFGNGETLKTVTIPLIDNNLVQGTVNMSVVLSNPTGGSTLTAPISATLFITDNDTGVAFLNATNFVNETNTPGTEPVLVQRIGNPNTAFQVNYATTDGTAVNGVNYSSVSGTLSFAVGETLKTVSVPLIYDPVVTGNLSFTMGLSGASAGAQVVAPSNTVVVIQDADAGLSFTNANFSVLKNAGNAVITVVCSNPSIEPAAGNSNTVPLSVHYSTADGTATAGIDYTTTSGTLVFTNGIGTNQFLVPILNNNSSVTGNRTFTVSLSNPTPPGKVTPIGTQTVTIIDSNSGLKFSSANYTVLKTNVAATINVFRTGFTDNVVSVNFVATNGTAVAGLNFIATNGTLIFTNGVTNQTFTVNVIDTTAVQPNLTVLLQLLNPTNDILATPNAATLTILDNTGSYVIPAGAALVSETGAGTPNGIIDSNETVQVLFAFRDAGFLNVTNLIATLLPVNGVTSPSGPQTYGPLLAEGHSVSQPFTFTAHGTNGQTIVPTFQLSDNAKLIGTNTFTFSLGSWITTFTNGSTIVINDNAAASPYPSPISVSGVGGTLIKAVVTVTNMNHTRSSDIDMLVVSPAVQDTLIMANAGGSHAIGQVTITFDDAATNSPLPQTGQIVSGTNQPTAYLPVLQFP